MHASEIRQLVEAEIAGDWSRTNAHGVDLGKCLVEPRRILCRNTFPLPRGDDVDQDGSYCQCKPNVGDQVSLSEGGGACQERHARYDSNPGHSECLSLHYQATQRRDDDSRCPPALAIVGSSTPDDGVPGTF
jgi:hypothetical protein